jgi:hypothetical protein
MLTWKNTTPVAMITPDAITEVTKAEPDRPAR